MTTRRHTAWTPNVCLIVNAAIWKAAVRMDEVIHDARQTNDNGEGGIGTRRHWSQSRQPGPHTGVIFTTSTEGDAQAVGHSQTEPRSRPQCHSRSSMWAQTMSVRQLMKIPIKVSPISYILNTCFILATTLRRPPSPALPHPFCCPGTHVLVLLGTWGCGGQCPWAVRRELQVTSALPSLRHPSLSHNSGFCEHWYLSTFTLVSHLSLLFLSLPFTRPTWPLCTDEGTREVMQEPNALPVSSLLPLSDHTGLFPENTPENLYLMTALPSH